MGSLCAAQEDNIEDMIEVLMGEGEFFILQSQYREALEKYDEAIGMTVDTEFSESNKGRLLIARVHDKRGQVYEKMENFDDGFRAYDAAILLSSQSSNLSAIAKFRCNKANLLGQIGKHHAAFEELLKAKRDDPTNEDIYIQKALLYSDLGEFGSAIQEFKILEKNVFEYEQGQKETIYELAYSMKVTEEWKENEFVDEKDVDRIIHMASIWKKNKNKREFRKDEKLLPEREIEESEEHI